MAMEDEEGQSPQTREWVARRQAADRAVENVRLSGQEDRALDRKDAEDRVRESPIFLIAGIILAGIVIVGGLWWFITEVECNPLISDRAFSSMCR
ncbi:MAG: hypothetical protein ACREFW_00440 [Rhizomicrobium sp.]